MSRICFRALHPALALLLVFASCGLASAGPLRSYIALGDSVAYGQTDVVPVSNGDQGYVKHFADGLAKSNGGVRPNVINLAIPGEQSTSFFTGVAPPGWVRAAGVNLNYADPTKSQLSMFQTFAAAEHAQGHVISHVSFALGSNDFFYLTGQPGFFELPAAQQQAQAGQTFAVLQANYAAALGEIRAAAPEAQLLLLNYYNPFAVLGPDDPLNQSALVFGALHQQLLEAAAAEFDGRVVDVYTPFLGKEAAYTHILSGDVHPNEQGYQAMADQMLAVANAPEPSSLLLVGIGVCGLAGYRFRRGGRSARN
ncbi:MAG: PEP-CTERM sorting domain-containing protein [Planctomycetia bacterium]|nr:PEP-CTERM sorting domain-containing protein [Planctomycetia bacterium]